MRRTANPHKRPIQVDIILLADTRCDAVKRLRKLADNIEKGRMLMMQTGKWSGGGNNDDFDFEYHNKAPNA